MDIVGAINHNLIVGAGVRSRARIKDGIVEVQLRVPTSPKPTILTARMPLAEYAQQVGGVDIVGGKIGKKIKKAAKKVVKNKAFKALTKVATGLAANIVAPGAGAALMTGVALAKKAKSLAKKAKKGDKNAAALLKAPLKLKAVKPGAKPKGPTLAMPARDQPRAAAPMRALPAPAESADQGGGDDQQESSDDEGGGGEAEAAALTSSEDEEEPAAAGVYMVQTPGGRQVKVTLP